MQIEMFALQGSRICAVCGGERRYVEASTVADALAAADRRPAPAIAPASDRRRPRVARMRKSKRAA